MTRTLRALLCLSLPCSLFPLSIYQSIRINRHGRAKELKTREASSGRQRRSCPRWHDAQRRVREAERVAGTGNRKKRKGERKKKAAGARMSYHYSLSSIGCNRSTVSCGLISPNQSVFWQNAPKWVSASKAPSLWMSNRQLSLNLMTII